MHQISFSIQIQKIKPQGGVCPGINTLATAKALATILDAVAGGTRLLSRQQQVCWCGGMRQANLSKHFSYTYTYPLQHTHHQALLRRTEATETCPLHGKRRWGLGLQVSEEGVSVAWERLDPCGFGKRDSCGADLFLLYSLQVLGHEAFGGSTGTSKQINKPKTTASPSLTKSHDTKNEQRSSSPGRARPSL
jgi:hypothetical protein